MWLRIKGEKNLKTLIRLHRANKVNNYGAGEGKKIQNNLQNKSKNKNNKCFTWVTAVLSLPRSYSPSHLLRIPSNTVLSSGPAVGVAQILMWSYSNVFLPPMSTAIRTSAFSFVGDLNDLFHRQRVCLVDHLDLICSCTAHGRVLGLLP